MTAKPKVIDVISADEDTRSQHLDIKRAPAGPPKAQTPAPKSEPDIFDTPSDIPRFGALQPKIDNHPLFSGVAEKPRRSRRSRLLRRTLWPLVSLLVVAGLLYLAVDAGVVKSSIKLPHHFFKQDVASVAPVITPVKTTAAAAPSIPTGFIAYKLSDAKLSFAYPSQWGTVSSQTEQGYLNRGGVNKTAGTYVYLLKFSENSKVQLALTSAKYLPPARDAAYYDYLGWCVGTNDAKLYKTVLHFSTAKGVDTPTTTTCDQGPLNDAVKLSGDTIAELKATTPAGAALGDLYTKDLAGADWPVLRVLDTNGNNADAIKQLLLTAQTTSS